MSALVLVIFFEFTCSRVMQKQVLKEIEKLKVLLLHLKVYCQPLCRLLII